MKRFMCFFILAIALINVRFLTNQLMSLSERPDMHHSVSRIHLSEAQRKEIIYANQRGSEVYRYQTSNKMWSVAVGKFPSGTINAIRIGTLFTEPLDGEVTTPVYLCAYPGYKGETISLDSDPYCSGDGLNLSTRPAGYVSAKVRSGYAPLVRCKSLEKGVYLTHNQRCDHRDDHVQGVMGTILVSQ